MKSFSAFICFLVLICGSSVRASQVQVQYTYDDINRLTGVTFDSVPMVGYTYDAAGNIVAVTANSVASPTVPGAPSNVVGVPGDAQVTVSFTTPSNTGGSAISGYTVTSSPGDITATGDASPITISGLTNGVPYTFTVKATNAIGAGPDSSASSPVTPAALLPSVSLAPSSLSFASQAQGSSSTVQTITLANTGAATLTIYSIVVSGDFSQGNTCGNNLAAGADCVISITFTPSAAGVCTGTLTVIDNAGGSPRSVSISGTGQANGGGGGLLNANLVAGWNLLGNSSTGTLDVVSLFGDRNKVTTVWKWMSGANPGWAFYTPTQDDGGAAYATGKGYSLLTNISSGEGFWVNATQAFSVSYGSGELLSTAAFQDATGTAGANPLASGWSLVAVGDNPSPRAFANGILNPFAPPPTPGTPAATTLISLWAWFPGDATHAAGWYFYAPTLDNSGGLANYLTGKGYLDFDAAGKTLDPTTGFWVNRP